MPFGQPGTPGTPAPGDAASGIMIGLPGDPQTTNWPYGSMPVPPAPRRRRRWPWVAGAVALLLVLGAVAVPLYQRLTRPTPTEQVQSALASLEHAAVIRLTGESVTMDGTPQRVTLSLAGKRAYGQVRGSAGSADVLVRHGVTYLRGDRAWWRGADETAALYLSGHWTAQTSGLSLDPTKLTQTGLAKYLGKGLRANADPDAHAKPAGAGYPSVLGSTAVTPYRLPNGSVVFVTANAPYRLAGIDRAPGAADGGYLDLTVATADKDSFASGFAKLAAGVHGDPKTPAHYDYHDKPKQGTCDPYSCTESVRLGADGGDTSRKGHVVGFFSSDEAGKHIVGTCSAKLPKMRPNHFARVSCTTRSQSWRRWTASGASTHYWVWILPLDPGYVGDHPNQVINVFTAGVDATDMDPDDIVLESEDALGVTDHLIAAGAWKGRAAVDAVHAICDAGALGVLEPLIMAGQVQLDQDSFGDWFNDEHLSAAVAAKEHAAAGSTKLALGSWQDPDDRTVKADLIDISAKTTVTTGRVTTTRRTRGDIEQAADRARKGTMPAGFGRQLRIVAGPGSALYWSSASGVAAALRAAGVTPGMLHGIRHIRVVTGFGTATLTPNQLRK
ncbi:hypothetical protein AB0I55_24830 [Actinocatenispora sera]|uniref:hypothetical protein n=1 Tax=Actinocatenispora sera TaxID=390989 RepID=UPI00340F7487